MIARLKRLAWYWWAVGILVPGGFLYLIWKARQTPAAPAARDVGTNAASITADNRAADVTAATQNLVADAKVQADTLRSALQNDPLAAALIGVSPSLVAAGSPADVAANTAKKQDLENQIADLQSKIAAANSGWNVNHFGGQTPDQFNAIIAGYQSQIDSLQTQLAAIP